MNGNNANKDSAINEGYVLFLFLFLFLGCPARSPDHFSQTASRISGCRYQTDFPGQTTKSDQNY